MSFNKVKESFSSDLEEIKKAGLWKTERIINSDQKSKIQLSDNQEVINMCANNYLGLANNPEVIQAAKDGLDRWGFGLASVRFICGTQTLHKTLEEKVSEYLGMEDTILYAACFDANGGLFETILTADDAVISDELNHASIIDGIRLCKAQRYRYKNNDMNDLRAKLEEAKKNKARRILITTDGVFSMDGTIAQLDKICDLADEFDAMVHHDDCHATGFMGKTGRGIHEYCNVMDRVDIITSTSTALRDTLEKNVHYFRAGMQKAGFDVSDGDHPIVPIMLGDANLAQSMSKKLLEKGIFAIGFFYPVVPQGKARIRTQISAAHTFEDLDKAIDAFTATKNQLI